MSEIVVIDHSFIEAVQRKRWRILAENYPVEVTLLVPRVWKSNWFGEEVRYSPERVEKDGYRVIPLPATSKTDWMKYLFLSTDMQFRSIQPDLVHVQYAAMALIHHQAILYKRLWGTDAKYTFFTMNALGVPQAKYHQRVRWRHLKTHADAAIGHYPGCRTSLEEAGYSKPIYQQTSYGVDEELFVPDDDERAEVRETLGFDGTFVIGYVGRLTADKGLDDLIEVLPLAGLDWSLLLVGDGEIRPEVQEVVCRKGWEDRVEITGYVPQVEVPRYLRAMDCFVLGSKTREHWIDTFPRSIVQAMACEVPVIGSDSGAIPFQVNDAGLIYPEGDVAALQERIHRLARDDSLREELARAGREESVGRFGQEVLAENFYEIFEQVRTGDIRYNEAGETKQYKAY